MGVLGGGVGLGGLCLVLVVCGRFGVLSLASGYVEPF